MTRRAFHRSRPVKQNQLLLQGSRCLVTRSAAHVLVSASQREVRARFMVEKRRLPLVGVVTLLATRAPSFPGKLVRVDILVASVAAGRRRCEGHVLHRHFEIGWLVAADARDGPVRS